MTPVSVTTNVEKWNRHIDWEIEGHGKLILEAKSKKLFAVAKIVAAVVGLILLYVIPTLFIAPTPFAMLLVPLTAYYLVYCVFPLAKNIRIWLAQTKAHHGQITLFRTTIQQLKACKEALPKHPELLASIPNSTEGLLKAFYKKNYINNFKIKIIDINH